MGNAKQYRQGDVLITECEASEGGEEVPREGGRVVLAHGEVTGHSHAISDAGATLVALGGEAAIRRLRLRGPVTLRHEEHDPIVLRGREYKIEIQREYVPGAIRNVED